MDWACSVAVVAVAALREEAPRLRGADMIELVSEALSIQRDKADKQWKKPWSIKVLWSVCPPPSFVCPQNHPKVEVTSASGRRSWRCRLSL
jgi:hypothetical protein